MYNKPIYNVSLDLRCSHSGKLRMKIFIAVINNKLPVVTPVIDPVKDPGKVFIISHLSRFDFSKSSKNLDLVNNCGQ